MRYMQKIGRATVALILLAGSFTHTDAAGAEPNSVRGIVRAVNKAVIATDLVARVARIPFRDGQSFKRGDIIIAFDCRRYHAELRATAARARAARHTLTANLKLQKHNAIGSSEVEISRAKLDEALGRMEALEVRTSRCEIKAPYDGRVVRNHIHEHEMPKANEPLVEIVGDRDLEIDLLVPSNWLVWLKPGDKFDFFIDETQRSHSAHVQRIGAVVEPISQTARLTAAFQHQGKSVLPGMSGTAYFKTFQKLSQGAANVQSTP